MLLIATDEAGYGPKLGPLVIVATAWNLPDSPPLESQLALERLFDGLRTPLRCQGVKIVVDDSKSVFQAQGKDGLKSLHAAVSAAVQWSLGTTGFPPKHTSLWLPIVAPEDCESILATPWLGQVPDDPFWTAQQVEPLIQQWQQAGVSLVKIAARIITARRFNDACDAGMNKADLLSETTLALVRNLLEATANKVSRAEVFCDRHGGRQYYSGVLQHTFHELPIQIGSESKQQSLYRFQHRSTEASIRFTVKGDSFAPVAMSSMIAKYLRERLMQSLNLHFAALHSGKRPLKPTAGYPVDADRYLADIAAIMKTHNIAPRDLVRMR